MLSSDRILYSYSIPTYAELAAHSASTDAISIYRAANTAKAYTGDLIRFKLWCHEQQVEPLPISGQTLMQFLNHLVAAGKRAATIQRYAAAVNKAHVVRGLQSPVRDPSFKGYLQQFAAGRCARRKPAPPELRWRF